MNEREALQIRKRFIDLSRQADRRCIVAFSNFLNVNELNIFHQSKADLVTSCKLSGGYACAERQMIAFIPDALSYACTDDALPDGYAFPIACLRISPAHPKFSEELSHRDILGALMHLGVDRSRIGDIKTDGMDAYIFCETGISDYLLDYLTQVKHTAVRGAYADAAFTFQQKFERLEGTVASNRLDSIIAFATGKSRSQGIALLKSQKVYVNAVTITEPSYLCKEGDILSIRGTGKFIYMGSSGKTRKERMKITLQKYV